jgi:hypothetical protein
MMAPEIGSIRFSVKGDRLDFPHGVKFVRLDFCDRQILIYDLNDRLVRKVEYLGVHRCHYDEPDVLTRAGTGIMGIGA